MTPTKEYTQTPGPIQCICCHKHLAHKEFYWRPNGDINCHRCRHCLVKYRHDQVLPRIVARCESQRLLYAAMSASDRPHPKVCANPSCPNRGAQPPENFVPSALSSDGLRVCCRFCFSIPKSKADAAVIKRAKLHNSKSWYAARSARYRAKHPARFREINQDQRFRRFGVSRSWYDATLVEQRGGCAICGSPKPGGTGRFAIDHDHSCCPGKRSCGMCVRGLLCSRCNLRLFSLEESDWQEWITKALIYLESAGTAKRGC